MIFKATILASLLTMPVGTFSIVLASEVPASVTLPPVVSTAWVAKHLDDPDLIILHIGPPNSYDEQHIPGARSASLRRLIRVNEAGIRDEMVDTDEISKALSELGIGQNSRIIVYFAEEGIAWGVARYLLTLEYVGMTGCVAYLDGGLPKWLAEERPVASEVPSVKTASLSLSAVPDVLVDLSWLSARFDKPGVSVIDGRPIEGYSGLAGEWDRLGHIPGAGNVPFFNLMAENPPYLLKSKEELSALFQQAGVEPGDTVVTYCGTGLWGSLAYLAARYLDYEVRLYDGSYQEWSATADLPVATTSEQAETDE